MTDIQKRWSVGNEEELTNYVAGRESVIGFFSNGLGGPNTLYSAMTFDARGLNFAPAQVAARKIVTEGDRYSFKYAAVQKDGKTAIEFLDRYKNDYLVNYVYGFSHGNFSYFLTIQKVSTSTHDLESRLVRVHHYDPSFFSYVEVATACRHSDDTVFNMAVASYLATDPDDSLNWLQGDEEKKSLYVAFARTVAGKHSEVDPTRGSVICSFSMKEIESEFVKAIEECYNGSGNRVNWIVKNTKCLPVVSFISHIFYLLNER